MQAGTPPFTHAAVDFGPPLHSLVLVGDAQGTELDLARAFCTNADEAPKLSDAALKKIDALAEAAGAAHEGLTVSHTLLGDSTDGDSDGGPDDADGAGATIGAAGAGGDAGGGTNRMGDPQQAHATPIVAGDAYGGDAPLDDLLGVLGLE